MNGGAGPLPGAKIINNICDKSFTPFLGKQLFYLRQCFW